MKEQEGTAVVEQAAEDASRKAGKYLTFKLASEEYGLEILKVKEIIGLLGITPIPRTPNHFRGIINLRGKVIPVVELRTKFGMEAIDDTEETCIIVVDIMQGDRSISLSILVDSVSEVMEIGSTEIEDTPEFGANINTEFILGMGKFKNRVVILLDIDKVMTCTELSLVEKTARKSN